MKELRLKRTPEINSLKEVSPQEILHGPLPIRHLFVKRTKYDAECPLDFGRSMLAGRLAVLIFLFLFSSARGQLPPVGIVDFYGLGSRSEEQVLEAVRIQPGDDAMQVVRSAEDYRRRLKSLSNVDDAAISLVCCDSLSGKSIVFIGLREKGAGVLGYRPAPIGELRLPAEISVAGGDFEAAFYRATEAKDFSEDDSQGHSLLGNAKVRAVQQRFVGLASAHFKILRRVLRESSDARHRALAAQVIAYSPHKRQIVLDLHYAMSDPDSNVRNNAMRALLILAKYAQANPRLRIHVPTIPFVRMLNSLVWTDRNKAAGALDVLTRDGDKALFAELKKHALVPLAEMARWKSGHAESSFSILGRVARLTEEAIRSAFEAPDRDKQTRLLLDKIAGLRATPPPPSKRPPI